MSKGSSDKSQERSGQGGRPKKDPEERRTESHGLYLSKKEKKELKRRAEAAGLSVNKYLRRSALGGEPISETAERKTLTELRSIGTTLEQLAHQTASGQVEAQTQYVLADLRKAINRLG
ncbi:plasmid mobilization protein [Salinibacter ruber]|uniref:plasmid mobilization protein n=1 Tax=Salinibacter ruber TaxID=146919 RepID=UPI002168CA66|nr:hypothetical protein [Salinibacter ruber]MCS3698376.1 hypothetical protein [Salinibacter ruber]